LVPIEVTMYTDLSSEEKEIMQEYISDVSEGIVVEIGMGRGGTALLLQRWLPDCRIYTIDPYPKMDIIPVLVDSGITVFRGTSAAVSKLWDEGPINLLFIDGAHDFQSLITDVASWLPFLSDDGVVIFDDYEPPNRGGASNLAVKVCLDALISTGMLTKLDHIQKLLKVKVNRLLQQSDIEACLEVYRQIGAVDTDLYTQRMTYIRLAQQLPDRFWELIVEAVDPIGFRLAVETYSQLNIATEPASNGLVGHLSRDIAQEQVRLNLVKQMYKTLRGD